MSETVRSPKSEGRSILSHVAHVARFSSVPRRLAEACE
jgi:hypothetical protein